MNQESVADSLRAATIQMELNIPTGEEIEMIKLEGQVRNRLAEVGLCWVSQVLIMRCGITLSVTE